jgi:hypothetical protein
MMQQLLLMMVHVHLLLQALTAQETVYLVLL